MGTAASTPFAPEVLLRNSSAHDLGGGLAGVDNGLTVKSNGDEGSSLDGSAGCAC